MENRGNDMSFSTKPKETKHTFLPMNKAAEFKEEYK